MWTIVSALKSELNPLFTYFPLLEKAPLNGGTVYRTDYLQLLRTGVGQEKTKQVFDAYLKTHHPDLVLNIGLAGSLTPEYEPGRIFSIKEVLHERTETIYKLPKLSADIPFAAARLLTVEKAVTEAPTRDGLHKEFAAELVDMEAFYLARKCRAEGIPFYSMKIISDRADQATEQMFMKNYKEKSKILCAAIRPFLPRVQNQ